MSGGLLAAAEIGRKVHNLLAQARQMMDGKLGGPRASSKLPALIEAVKVA